MDCRSKIWELRDGRGGKAAGVGFGVGKGRVIYERHDWKNGKSNR